MSAISIEARPHFLFEVRHEQIRQTIREFVEREVNPLADQWEQQERIPKSLFLRGGELGFFAHSAPENYGGLGIDCRTPGRNYLCFALVFRRETERSLRAASGTQTDQVRHLGQERADVFGFYQHAAARFLPIFLRAAVAVLSNGCGCRLVFLPFCVGKHATPGFGRFHIRIAQYELVRPVIQLAHGFRSRSCHVYRVTTCF